MRLTPRQVALLLGLSEAAVRFWLAFDIRAEGDIAISLLRKKLGKPLTELPPEAATNGIQVVADYKHANAAWRTVFRALPARSGEKYLEIAGSLHDLWPKLARRRPRTVVQFLEPGKYNPLPELFRGLAWKPHLIRVKRTTFINYDGKRFRGHMQDGEALRKLRADLVASERRRT